MFNLLALIVLVLVFLFGPRIFRLRNEIRSKLFIVTASYFFGQLWVYLWATIFKLPSALLILMGLLGIVLMLWFLNMLEKRYLAYDIRIKQVMLIYGYILGPTWIYLCCANLFELTYSSAILASLAGAILFSVLMLLFLNWSMRNVYRPLEAWIALGIHFTASAVFIISMTLTSWIIS